MILLSDALSKVVYFVIDLRLNADLVFCVQMVFDIYLSCNTDTTNLKDSSIENRLEHSLLLFFLQTNKNKQTS